MILPMSIAIIVCYFIERMYDRQEDKIADMELSFMNMKENDDI